MISPFSNISEKNKKDLLDILGTHTYTYKKNQDILSTFKSDNIIGIILEGSCQIKRNFYDGNRINTEILKKDDIFSTNISSLNNNEFSIIAKEKTMILSIGYNDLIENNHLKKTYYCQFIKNLFEILNEKIKEKNERIRILSCKGIRNKLLEYFTIEQEKHHSKYIYLESTFSNLANYLAIDRSAMTRELKYLKEEGFIEIKGKRITMIDY